MQALFWKISGSGHPARSPSPPSRQGKGADRGTPAGLHIVPPGVHGQSLADPTVFAPDRQWQLSVPCAAWVERCHAWLQRNFCAPGRK